MVNDYFSFSFDVSHFFPGNYIGETGEGDGFAVSRILKEGDVVGGFKVIETPGHSSGHISFFRLLPRKGWSADSWRSIRKLLSLEPAVL